jgi:hypothetical protein
MQIRAFNGLLRSASATPSGVDLSYESASRALAVLEKPPVALTLDGAPFPIQMAGLTLVLPRGHHTVSIQ